MTPTELRKAAAEVEGKQVIDVPFVPRKIRPYDWTVFTPEAAKEWRKTYPSCSWCPVLDEYDLDPIAALRLVEVMKRKGYELDMRMRPNLHADGDWYVNFCKYVDNGEKIEVIESSAWAATLPLAITQAALKATEAQR